jgi:phosphoenolpyruvate carboxykinase (ATP)
MVRAVLAGALDSVETTVDPVFGLHVPTAVPEVPVDVLDQRSTWSDPAAYDEQAMKLAGMFRTNFERFGDTAREIREAGPKG